MADRRGSKHVKPMVFPSQLMRRGRGEDFGELPMPRGRTAAHQSLTVNIVDSSRPGAPAKRVVFRQPSITIGRSRKCDQQLDDRRQVVSGKHARISIEAGKLCVSDLGSRNFTYLDGQRLEPHTPYELGPGSTVTIAEFEIQVDVDQAAAEEAEPPTVFEPGYDNPFKDEAAELARVLERLGELYRSEASGRRDEALKEALEQVLGDKASAEGGPAAWIAGSRTDDGG